MTKPNRPYGICVKCNKYKQLQNHHYKGYRTHETALYCSSCDKKAHLKARREGRCNLTSKETSKLSQSSLYRTQIQMIVFEETLDTNIQLREQLTYNKFTGHITYCSYFKTSGEKTLLQYEELNYCNECIQYYGSVCKNCGQTVTRELLAEIYNDEQELGYVKQNS